MAQWFPGSGHEVLLGPAEHDFLRAYSSNVGALPDYPAAQAAAGAVLAVQCARLAGRATREDLWAAAATLDSSTLFGAFKIDPRSGARSEERRVGKEYRARGRGVA